MATNRNLRFKTSRRFGVNVYGHPKALKRQPAEARQKKMSEYGIQLAEKQKVKAMYNLLEKQFYRYYDKAKRMSGVVGENLLFLLETRLDNVVYRAGFARSIRQARQMVTHGLINVDGKRGFLMNPYAFITGATSGIGLATAKALAASHYDLVLAARNTEKLASVKTDIEKESGVKVTTYPLDVQDREAIQEVTTKVLDTFGAPDVLMNDAGLARGLEPYQDTAPEDTMEMIDTNIKGLFLVTRAFLPAMVKENKGHIVNLGSTAGLYAYAGAAVYCATKAAVKTFSDGLRIDVMASDVKITTIQPGLVETPFSEVRFHGDTKRAASVYAGIDALQAEDIADVIAFVVSRPKRVQISDVVIMAAQQGTGFLVSKK